MGGFDELERRMNITNSMDHPTNENYTVFRFSMKQQADYFKNLLNEKNIRFESDTDTVKGETAYFFAILKTDLDIVNTLNYRTLGEFRKPFIPNKSLKWFIIIIGFSALVLAVIGFLLKK